MQRFKQHLFDTYGATPCSVQGCRGHAQPGQLPIHADVYGKFAYANVVYLRKPNNQRAQIAAYLSLVAYFRRDGNVGWAKSSLTVAKKWRSLA